jgi:hypothetical protein
MNSCQSDFVGHYAGAARSSSTEQANTVAW